jgi:hypothetical protein
MSGIFDKLKAEIDRLAEGENRFTVKNLACVASWLAFCTRRLLLVPLLLLSSLVTL